MSRFGCQHQLVETGKSGDGPVYECRLCGATLYGKGATLPISSLWRTGSIGLLAILCLIGVVTWLSLHHAAPTVAVPANKAFILKLESAKHVKSTNPAPGQTLWLAENASLRSAALNAIGQEPRDVRLMASGSPEVVFDMLSHLGGLGEIIWVDSDWTNLPVKLPPTSPLDQVPRREAVKAALDSIEASGGCLIKAGENRYLVAKVSEQKEYEAAIRAEGWLNGNQPPWEKSNGGTP